MQPKSGGASARRSSGGARAACAGCRDRRRCSHRRHAARAARTRLQRDGAIHALQLFASAGPPVGPQHAARAAGNGAAVAGCVARRTHLAPT